MKKKLLSLAMLLSLIPLASCGEPSESSSPAISTKYEINNGEVVINDPELINSPKIDDNYRVFYEIFTGSFSDSNGDGVGDLQGIINRLDYLNDGNPNSGKSLGIQGIWLTPIFKSPTYHKYDVSDYYQIDPEFGTMDDLKNLIAKCHERNIKLILDLPINHTGNYNMWFNNFVSAHNNNDTTNKYYNYYCYYHQNGGGSPEPGKSYGLVAGTDLFYEANFTTNMPELNYDCEDVRKDVLDVAKYYLNLGIDGFRFDAAKYIYYGDNQKSAEFWNWYVGELKKIKPDIYTVGEVWDAEAVIDTYYKNNLGCFSFPMSQAEGKIAATAKKGNVTVFTNYVESYKKKIEGYSQGAMMHPFIANHDTDRAAGYLQLMTKFAHMAANLYILSSGSPFIYYGEEIGLKGSRGGASSDANRRLAMLWGDNDTIKDPYEATYKKTNQTNGTVSSQLADENSLLNHYKKLIMIRNANPEIARGEYRAIPSTEYTVGGFEATYNGSTVCVIHNTSQSEKTIDLTGLTTKEYSQIRAYIGADGYKFENNILTIPGQSSIVLK